MHHKAPTPRTPAPTLPLSGTRVLCAPPSWPSIAGCVVLKPQRKCQSATPWPPPSFAPSGGRGAKASPVRAVRTARLPPTSKPVEVGEVIARFSLAPPRPTKEIGSEPSEPYCVDPAGANSPW
jgi:hypothetical protein